MINLKKLIKLFLILTKKGIMEKIQQLNDLLDEFNQVRDEISSKHPQIAEEIITMTMKTSFKNIPSYLKSSLELDYELFTKYFNFIQNKLQKLINKYDDIDQIKKWLFGKYLNESNDTKKSFIKINNSLIKWFGDNEIIENYVGEEKINIDLTSIDNEVNKLNKIELRPNQQEAFDRLERNGIETGIHCQATGSGKTFIILKYLDYINRVKTNPRVILFTERVSILKDLFEFDKVSLNPSKNKILKWKNLGIADLTKYKIIERIITKNDEWIEELGKNNEPTLIVINRAYLTHKKKYKNIEELDLVLHDECHNTSSVQCHNFLKFCKNELKTQIIGFSATPLRTGKNDVPKLKEIYGDKKKNLILLTDYNMIHAIKKNLILPPNFYWYQMIEDKKNKNKLVSQLELGSILELLNHILPTLPNKKLVAWCRTIALSKKWKELFESSYQQRSNLINFKFGLDVSTNDDIDYNEFKKSEGNHILFCANKHREGSDIKHLDGCIFLDKVKKRSPIPFIQSIGRVLRIDVENPEKTFGVIIDGYVKNNGGYEKEFIDKIISYYLALQNMSGLDNKIMETKYDKYIKLMNIIQFNKEKEIITMNLGGNKIKIHCNRLPWEEVINKFEPILQERIRLSSEDNFKHKGKILKEKFRFHKNTDFVDEYKKIDEKFLKKYNLPLVGSNDYLELFRKCSWYKFCDIGHNFYIDMSEAIDGLSNKNISIMNPKANWNKWCKKDNRLPKYPNYIWSEFDYKYFNIDKGKKNNFY